MHGFTLSRSLRMLGFMRARAIAFPVGIWPLVSVCLMPYAAERCRQNEQWHATPFTKVEKLRPATCL